MYKFRGGADRQMELSEYMEPFGGVLRSDNRWVRGAAAINWADIEAEYALHFASGGKEAIAARPAVGALIIKKVLGISDVQLLRLLPESPYLLYFLGYREVIVGAPFSKSALKAFRKRIAPGRVAAMARLVEGAGKEPPEQGTDRL